MAVSSVSNARGETLASFEQIWFRLQRTPDGEERYRFAQDLVVCCAFCGRIRTREGHWVIYQGPVGTLSTATALIVSLATSDNIQPVVPRSPQVARDL